MSHRLTEGARRVVVLAQEEARILKHKSIGAEHILLGLLRVEEGLAARVLESLGITVERVRAQVLRIVGSEEEIGSGQIVFNPLAQKVLLLAPHEALSLGHDEIDTGHILLGLARQQEGFTARMLLDSDADPAKIRNEVIQMLRAFGGLQSTPVQGHANVERSVRARTKYALRSGRLDLAELIRAPPPELLTAKVADLLLATGAYGRVRTSRVLKQARISPGKTVAGLSARQRRELLEYLRVPPPDRSGGP